MTLEDLLHDLINAVITIKVHCKSASKGHEDALDAIRQIDMQADRIDLAAHQYAKEHHES